MTQLTKAEAIKKELAFGLKEGMLAEVVRAFPGKYTRDRLTKIANGADQTTKETDELFEDLGLEG